MSPIIVLGVALALTADEPQKPPATVVEQIVAVVDRQTITLVDVKRAAAIEIAKHVGSRVYAQPWPKGFLSEIRTHLMKRTLLLDEARRYSQQEPSVAEVDAALDAFKTRFENDKGYKRFLEQTLLTEEELRDDLRKSLYVDRFLSVRIRSRIEVPEQLDEATRQRMIDEAFIKQSVAFMRELVERAEVRMLGEVPDVPLYLPHLRGTDDPGDVKVGP